MEVVAKFVSQRSEPQFYRLKTVFCCDDGLLDANSVTAPAIALSRQRLNVRNSATSIGAPVSKRDSSRLGRHRHNPGLPA